MHSLCDSRAALQRIRDLSYEGFGTTWRCRANYDIEAAIRFCLEQQPLRMTWQWVKGHASQHKKPQDFTWAETLNEKADNLATAAREDRHFPDQSHWPEQVVSITGPRGRICGRLANEIRYCCTTVDLKSYWQTRYN